MLAWVIENLSTLIISAILIAAVTAVVLSMIRGRKKGKSSCGCGCADCALRSSCHSEGNPSDNSQSRHINTPQ